MSSLAAVVASAFEESESGSLSSGSFVPSHSVNLSRRSSQDSHATNHTRDTSSTDDSWSQPLASNGLLSRAFDNLQPLSVAPAPSPPPFPFDATAASREDAHTHAPANHSANSRDFYEPSSVRREEILNGASSSFHGVASNHFASATPTPAASAAPSLHFPLAVPNPPSVHSSLNSTDTSQSEQHLPPPSAYLSGSSTHHVPSSAVGPRSAAAPLDSPDELLRSMLLRDTEREVRARAASLHSSARGPVGARALSSPSPHPLSQSTSSLHARLDRSRLRGDGGERAALDRTKDAEHFWMEEITHLHRAHAAALEAKESAHAAALDAKEKSHTYEQADLLSAFHNDRTETTKKAQGTITALKAELEKTEKNLSEHQALYVNYSDRIQTELAALRRDILDANHTIQAQEARAVAQEARIVEMTRELERRETDRAKEKEQESSERARWEAALLHQSQSVLELKQQSFDAERQEKEMAVRTLAQQLDLQTSARVEFERRSNEAETERKTAADSIHRLESVARETESMLRSQRELNAEVTTAYSQLEELTRKSSLEVQHLRAQLQARDTDHRHLDQASSELSTRAQQMSQECTRLREALEKGRVESESLRVDLRTSTTDRLALQHAFVRVRARARLQKLFCHWICITQAVKFRHRELALALARRVRRTQQDALRQWLTHARIQTAQMRHQEETDALKQHVAVVADEQRIKRVQAGVFRAWCSVKRSPQQSSSPRAATTAAADVEVERSKKIELYHLLQRERAEWLERQGKLEARLQDAESDRRKHRDELDAMQRLVTRMQEEQAQLAHFRSLTSPEFRPTTTLSPTPAYPPTSSPPPPQSPPSRDTQPPASSPAWVVYPAPASLMSPHFPSAVLPSSSAIAPSSPPQRQRDGLADFQMASTTSSQQQQHQDELHHLQFAIANERARLRAMTQMRESLEFESGAGGGGQPHSPRSPLSHTRSRSVSLPRGSSGPATKKAAPSASLLHATIASRGKSTKKALR